MAALLMPYLADGMEGGVIARWLRADGDQVISGEGIVEIETEKSVVVHEADSTGTLRIVAAEDAWVAVGEPIAWIGDDKAAPPASAPAAASASTTPAPAAAKEPAAPTGALNVSPIARRFAKQEGIDLADVVGTGAGGRIVKPDVQAAVDRRAGGAAPTMAPAPEPDAAAGDAEIVELSRMQAAIARRTTETKATVPDFQVAVDVDMQPVTALRAQLKALGSASGERTPSINDIVVAAVAAALREHPRVNGRFVNGTFELFRRIGVGIAVSSPDALIVPVLKDADRLTLTQIAERSAELSERARRGVLEVEDLSGGTISISNLGMLGVSHFTAVLNAGQAAILAVGAVREEPVVNDGRIEIGHRMTVTMTCDHRILYGADAAAFLARLREILEAPLQLLRSSDR